MSRGDRYRPHRCARPADHVGTLAEDLRAELQHRFPSISWCIIRVVDPLVQLPADDVCIVRAARPPYRASTDVLTEGLASTERGAG